MTDLLIGNDSRNPKEIVTYIAKTAFLVEMEGAPATGHAATASGQSLRDNGALESATFHPVAVRSRALRQRPEGGDPRGVRIAICRSSSIRT